MTDHGDANPVTPAEAKRRLLERILRQKLAEDRPSHRASKNQEGLWILQQRDPESTAYNQRFPMRIRGDLNGEAFASALRRLAQRHEVLRTTFAYRNGQLMQDIHDQLPTDVTCLSGESWSDEALTEYMISESARPFDLETGPLYRARLIRRSSDTWALLLSMHHIVTDLWTSTLLMEDLLGSVYPAELSGREPPPVRDGRSFADFATWQNEILEGPEGERLWTYWREKLEDLGTGLRFPMARERGPAGASLACWVLRELPLRLSRGVRAFGRRVQTSPFVITLAAVQALIARYSGQDTFLVTSPTSGRTRNEFMGTVGFLTNEVPLCADVSGDPSFRELVARVRETVFGALENEDFPISMMVERVQPLREMRSGPSHQVSFSWETPNLLGRYREGMRSSISDGGLRLGSAEGPGNFLMEMIPLPSATANDLAIIAFDSGDCLSLNLCYDSGLFDADLMEEMCRSLERLLEAAIANPDSRVSRLALIDDRERAALVASATRPVERPELVHDCFRTQVQRSPDATAAETDGDRVTFRELDRRAEVIAQQLRSLGARRGVVVAICVRPALDAVAALFGVLRSGAAYLLLDPGHPSERLLEMLRDSEVLAFMVDPETAARLPAEAEPFLVLEEGWHAEQSRGDLPAASIDRGDAAYVLYTSGSTGRPKGVVVSHENLARFVDSWSRFEPTLEPRRVHAITARMSFDVFIAAILNTLLDGGRVVLCTDAVVADPARLLAQIDDAGVNSIDFVPSVLRSVLHHVEEHEGTLAALRTVFIGGEPLPARDCERLRRLGGPEMRILNVYGLTETTIDNTCYEVSASSLESYTTAPIGRPLPGERVLLLDAHMEPVPSGVPGEIYIGGPGVALGYLRRPALTAERFVPDPFGTDPGARLYRTGDRAVRDASGVLRWLDRLDDQVQIRGARVELGEIESQILALPDVRQAAVTVHPSPGGNAVLVGYVVPAAQATNVEESVRRALLERLPAHMLPSQIVCMETLPLNAHGKIERSALPPPPRGARSVRESRAPLGSIEEIVAGIWQSALGCEQVRIDDDFFALGGYSLLAVRVISRVREALGTRIAVASLFEASTFSAFVREVERAARQDDAGSVPVIAKAPREAGRRLSLVEEQIWLAQQLTPGSPAYNMPAALRVQGPFDARTFADGVGEVVRRHEVLRTAFSDEAGTPHPRVIEESPVRLRFADLGGLEPAARSRSMKSCVQREAMRCFDLARGPLLRISVLRLGPSEHVLCMTVHHLVCDAWSIQLLMREVAARYGASLAGRAVDAPALEIQYGDFAHWQRELLESECLEAELDRWADKLTGAPEGISLHDDPGQSENPSRGHGIEYVQIDSDIGARLGSLSRQSNATLFIGLQAALGLLLSRTAGQDELVLGVTRAGRENPALEPLIGCFIEVAPLRLDLSGNPSFRELLERTRRAVLDNYDMRALPPAMLVDRLRSRGETDRRSIFRVLVDFQSEREPLIELPGLTFEFIDQEFAFAARLDLDVFFAERDEGLGAAFVYNPESYRPATISRLARRFGGVLEAMVDDPDRPVDEITLEPLDEPGHRIRRRRRDVPGSSTPPG